MIQGRTFYLSRVIEIIMPLPNEELLNECSDGGTVKSLRLRCCFAQQSRASPDFDLLDNYG